MYGLYCAQVVVCVCIKHDIGMFTCYKTYYRFYTIYTLHTYNIYMCSIYGVKPMSTYLIVCISSMQTGCRQSFKIPVCVTDCRQLIFQHREDLGQVNRAIVCQSPRESSIFDWLFLLPLLFYSNFRINPHVCNSEIIFFLNVCMC